MYRVINAVTVQEGVERYQVGLKVNIDMYMCACVLVCFATALWAFTCFVCFLCTDMATDSSSLRIGVVGFGHLGLNSSFKSQANTL